jgi:D-alanine-D-alanine ligase
MRIALLHNLRPANSAAVYPDDLYEEYDSSDTIEAVQAALAALGADVTPVLADRRLAHELEAGSYDLVFNLAEGAGRRCREAVPAAVCDALGLPVTGSDVLTLAVALDKAIAKRVVSPEVPVPRGFVLECGESLDVLPPLPFPLIAKPNDEGSSKGIRGQPVVHHLDGLRACCERLHRDYQCPVLVEEFLPGAEVTIGVLGNGRGSRVIGLMEIAPVETNGPFVYSLEVKRDWRRRVQYHLPPRLPAGTIARLEALALTAYRLLGCRDFARLDFRLDAGGAPRFLECNPLPGLNPESGDLVLLARPVLSHRELIHAILREAVARHGLRLPSRSPSKK